MFDVVLDIWRVVEGGGFVGGGGWWGGLVTRPHPTTIGGGVGLVLVGLVGGFVSSVDVGGGRLEGGGGGDEVGGGLTRPDPTIIGGGVGLVLVGLVGG